MSHFLPHWYFLAVFFTFVALFYTGLILIKKQHDDPVVFMGKPFTCHWWNHLAFRVFRAAIWLVCITLAVYPDLLALLLPFNRLLQPALMWSGAGLLVVGFIIAVVANFTLGHHWRSGIVEHDTHVLIQSGIYRLSRNPGYIGVAVAQVGFFLALPSVFSLVCLIIGLTALRGQTLLEETFLLKRYQHHYLSYQSTVPRWL